MDSLAQSPGSFTVDDADGFQTGDHGIIKVFLQSHDRFIHRVPKQVDLRLDGGGLVDAVAVPAMVRRLVLLFFFRPVQKFQVFVVDGGGQEAHLDLDIPVLVGFLDHGAVDGEGGDKYGISNFKVLGSRHFTGLFPLEGNLSLQLGHALAQVTAAGLHFFGIVLAGMLFPGIVLADGFVCNLLGLGDDAVGFLSGFLEQLGPLFFQVVPVLREALAKFFNLLPGGGEGSFFFLNLCPAFFQLGEHVFEIDRGGVDL